MLAFRKGCSAGARASSKSLYQWRHAQKKQVVGGMMGRGAWALELPRSSIPSWRPHTTPTSPFSRPMLLLATRGAKRGTAPPTTKPKNSGQQHKIQHPDVKSTSDLFMRWEIPWDGKTVVITMTAFVVSFLFTGVVIFIGSGFMQRQPLDSDDMSLLVFTSTVLQALVGTSVMKACIKRYSPLPKELFSYDWRDPFSARRGWLLWGVVGSFCSLVVVYLLAAVTTKESFSRRQDILFQVSPMIGASGTSTALLLSSMTIVAPIFEEIVFRGFLLTSLTKCMDASSPHFVLDSTRVPTYVAVLGSAGVFALAHLNPGKLPELFALGVVIGFSYAKTGNLLTPIMMHGLWNSTGILVVLLLQRKGYDVQKFLEDPISFIRRPVNKTAHCVGKE